MSTANFHNVNASRIYMVRCEDEFDYDFTKENVLHELKRKGWYAYTPSSRNGLRSYPGTIFARKGTEIHIGESYTSVDICAIIRAGYYADANLDWVIEINGESYDYGEFTLEDAKEHLQDYYPYYSGGFSKMQAKNLLRKIREAVDELTAELESVYESWSEPLVCVGMFGNGEAIYKSASNPLGVRRNPKAV